MLYLLPEQFMNVKIVLSKLRPGAVPPYHMLLSCPIKNKTITFRHKKEALYKGNAFAWKSTFYNASVIETCDLSEMRHFYVLSKSKILP